MKSCTSECGIVCCISLIVALLIISPLLVMFYVLMDKPNCEKQGRFHKVEVEWKITTGCLVKYDDQLMTMTDYIMKVKR